MEKKIRQSHMEMRVSTILKVIKAIQSGAKSKREIQYTTGISWGSCSGIYNFLVNKHLITPAKEKSNIPHTKGRKTINFDFNKENNLILGLEISSNKISCSTITYGKEELYYEDYPFQEKSSSENILEQIRNAVTLHLKKNELKLDNFNGISFSLSGAVDKNNLIWISTPHIKEIQNLDFKKLYKLLPGIKLIQIEHDINARTISTMKSQKWDDDNYVFVHVGTGIGMSIYNDGFYTGDRGLAGEIGHIPYPNMKEKIKCSCGKYNCLETVLGFKNSTSHKKQDVKEKNKSMNHIVEPLLFLCITAVNLFDPKTIVIGGIGVEEYYDSIKEIVERELPKLSWLGGPQKVKWYKESQGNGAYGAALNLSNQIIEEHIKKIVI